MLGVEQGEELELGWIPAVQPQKGGWEEHQITCPEMQGQRTWDCSQEGAQTQELSPFLCPR